MPRRSRLGPDFLGIGPPKTGTSWLFQNLREHPGVWLPPVKELHWFDQVQDGGPYPWGRLVFDRDPVVRRWRAYTAMQVRSHLLARAAVAPAWKLRYVFRCRSDGDYLRLFDAAGDRVAGEITPNYADLDDRHVARVAAVAPRARIILTMRNPIERSWSECRRLLGRRRNRPVADIPHDEIMAFLAGPESLVRSDYVTILARWRRHFPAEQVLAVFLDDIAADPAGTLLDVFRFVGVAARAEHVPATVAEKAHVGWGDPAVPPAYRHRLAELLRDPIARVAGELGGPARAWLDYAEAS